MYIYEIINLIFSRHEISVQPNTFEPIEGKFRFAIKFSPRFAQQNDGKETNRSLWKIFCHSTHNNIIVHASAPLSVSFPRANRFTWTLQIILILKVLEQIINTPRRACACTVLSACRLISLNHYLHNTSNICSHYSRRRQSIALWYARSIVLYFFHLFSPFSFLSFFPLVSSFPSQVLQTIDPKTFRYGDFYRPVEY